MYALIIAYLVIYVGWPEVAVFVLALSAGMYLALWLHDRHK